MYSTLCNNIRDGSEYSIPSWPMAIPSSIAIVLNSAQNILALQLWIYLLSYLVEMGVARTNWVNELTIAITVSRIDLFIPLHA